MAPRLAAVDHRGIERRHLLDGVGEVFGLRGVVGIQTPVGFLPGRRMARLELRAEMFPHQGVGIQGVRCARVALGQEPGMAQPGDGPLPLRLRQRLGLRRTPEAENILAVAVP